jgi:hypothetical protein
VLGVNGIIVSFRWVYDTQRSADYPGFYMWKGLCKQWCLFDSVCKLMCSLEHSLTLKVKNLCNLM